MITGTAPEVEAIRNQLIPNVMSFSHLLQPFEKNPKSVNEIIIALKKQLIGGHQLEQTFIQKLVAKWFPYDRDVNINCLLRTFREMIYGTNDSEPEPEKTRIQICNELQKSDLLVILIDKLPDFVFDGWTDIALIYQYVIQRQIGTRFPVVGYIASNPQIIEQLVRCYVDPQLCTICGQIIREFLRFEILTEKFLNGENQNHNKYYIEILMALKTDSFIVCADSFQTLNEMLFRFKFLVKEVLIRDYNIFFDKINEMLRNDRYYLKRKAFKLLADILLDRNHQLVMKKYISEPSNQTRIEILMNSDCKSIAKDAKNIYNLLIKPKPKTIY